METRILVGLVLLILLAWSIWRWWHAGDKEYQVDPADDAAPPPEFTPTQPDDREQPLDGGPGPVKPK